MRSFRAISASVILTLLPLPAAAQDTPNMTIVLDGSGSMWGQIEGRPKLEIAREMLSDVLVDVPANARLGLVAYGHRQKGECSDIEVLVPPGQNNQDAIRKAAANMRFLGKTPLTEATRKAATNLRYREEKATLVVVTDGLETCGGDLCALAQELENNGIDFTAHVVGFGLSQEEGAQVSCLAEKTGGQYFEASNAAALKDALSTSIVETASAAKKPAADLAKSKGRATVEAPATAVILSNVEVVWDGPADEGDYIDLVRADQPQGTWLTYAELKGDGPVLLKMPPGPGDYVIRYISPKQSHETLGSTAIAVTEGAFTLDGPASAEIGASIVVNWKGPNGDEDYLDIVPRGSSQTENETTWAYTRDGSPARIRAPLQTGDYDLRYIVQGERERAIGMVVPIRVTASQAKIVAPPAVRPGVEFPVRAEGPLDDAYWVDLVPAGYEPHSGELSYFYLPPREKGFVQNTLTAPSEPGDYELRYVMEDARSNRATIVRIPIAVSPDAPEDIALPVAGSANSISEDNEARSETGPGSPGPAAEDEPQSLALPMNGKSADTISNQLLGN